LKNTENEYYLKFGVHAKEFLIKRFGTVKDASERLHIHPSLLSQYFYGKKKPSGKFASDMQQLGFDMSYFALVNGMHDLSSGEDGVLTYNEMKFIYLELKKLIEEKNDIIRRQDIFINRLKHYDE